jgi:hypothetical protein
MSSHCRYGIGRPAKESPFQPFPVRSRESLSKPLAKSAADELIFTVNEKPSH